jgi:ABC-type multidrug transport system permease subunit
VADIGLLVVSLIFVFIGLIATSIFFAPLMVLVGARGGFTHAILPFGSVLSGFILPIVKLPQALEVLARWVPSSWAMESVWRSVQGPGSWSQIMTGWGVCILVSIVWFAVTYFMYNIVEKRIRITGTLGAY